jgi:uncharacterized protein involved in exopolysaccharide biosynthesis
MEPTDEVDLAALWRVIWSRRLVVALVIFLCGSLATLYAILTKPVFRAEAVVTQVRDPSAAGGGALGQLSGLASLAGVNLGGNPASQRDALAILKSSRLDEEFISRNGLLAVLFPKPGARQTLWFGVRKFREGVIQIREDSRQGVIIVAVDWNDPVVAARWANGFVALANETLRSRALQESATNIAYLKDQVAHTDVVELRRALSDLIENETKTQMLANGRKEYAFTVVDPAVPPELKIRPHRAVIVLFGLALGFLLGSGAVLILDRTKHRTAAARHP